MINILKQINSKDWKLYILGGDAQKQEGMNYLQSVIKDNGLVDEGILTGNVSDVEKYYCKSKIFAFTSSLEGFPNVIGEAMSADLPIITYNCVAGPSKMIEEGINGFLIGQFDDEEFKKKLIRLITNDKLRRSMVEKFKKMIDKFSVESIGYEY